MQAPHPSGNLVETQLAAYVPVSLPSHGLTRMPHVLSPSFWHRPDCCGPGRMAALGLSVGEGAPQEEALSGDSCVSPSPAQHSLSPPHLFLCKEE